MSPSASFRNASAEACSSSSNAGPSCASGNTELTRCPLASTSRTRGSRNGPDGSRYFLLMPLTPAGALPRTRSRTVNASVERKQYAAKAATRTPKAAE
uniref:Uncharacterized protein n=1 Tax=Arundo donax TaxID=35708 RepID=A0A0A9D8R2_ARUDO